MKRLLPLLLASIALNPVPASAQDAFSSDMMAPTMPNPQGGTCLPRAIAQDADIVVLAVNQPDGFPLMIRMGSQQSDAANLVTVTGGSGRDVVLLLGSTASVIWDLRGIPEDRIKGVIVSSPGSSQSGVAGLPQGVAIEYANYTNARSRGYDIDCLAIPVSHSLEGLPVLTKSVTARFGRIPDRMYADGSALGFDLDDGIVDEVSPEAPNAQQISAPVPVASLDTLPGEAGIKQLVERGVLKPFGPADAQKWSQAGATFSNLLSIEERIDMQVGGNTNPEIRERMRTVFENQDRNLGPRAGFVATSSFTIPSGYRPSPQNTIVAPAGVQVDLGDARLGPHSFLLRVSGIDAEELVTSGNPIDDHLRQSQRPNDQGVAFEAAWNSDGIMLTFPKEDIVSVEQADQEGDTWPWLLAGLFGVLAAGLGGALFFVMRSRRPVGR